MAFFKAIGRSLRKRLNRQFYVFLACLLVSVFIWLLMALSRNYTTFVRFPVRYENLPEDKVVVNDLPPSIKLEINSHGFDLLSYKFFHREKKLQVDVGKLKYRERADHSYLPTQELIGDLTEQFNDQTKILKVHPDTLKVVYGDKMTRMVPVRPVTDLDLRKQFRVSGDIEVEPPRVEVKGPVSLVDSLQTVRTEVLSLSGLDKIVTREVSLARERYPGKMTFEPARVQLTIPVDEFTERSISIPVKVREETKGMELKTYPDSVDVSFQVGFRSYNKVEKNMFRAVVDIPKDPEKLRELSKLKVKLTDHPAFVEDVRWEPESVEFIIHK